MQVLNQNNIVGVSGNNFSGRTNFLKNFSNYLPLRIGNQNRTKSIYISPNPNCSISGLVPTVGEELKLYNYPNSIYRSSLSRLVYDFGFDKLFDRNPFTLSGGEQVVLSLLTALSIAPSIVSIDCVLEQLHPSIKFPLLEGISDGKFDGTKVFLADNRLNEFVKIPKIAIPTDFPPEKIETDLGFQNLNSESFETYHDSVAASRLSLKNIGFSYVKGIPVLKNINIELDAGNLYHLKGMNGAGKSTLAKVLSGVLRPDHGEVYLDNRKYDSYRHPGLQIGYHFQNPDEQLFSNTVERELFPVFKRNSKDPIRLMSESYDQNLIKTFCFDKILQQHPLEMPFVIRKRIALAATLTMQRSWLVLDEPTLGQDDKNAWHISQIIRKLLLTGTGIILISHSNWFRDLLPIKSLHLENGSIIL